MSVQVEGSRRERKKNATRQSIHDAASDLVAERGLGGVTVEAIANLADVAPRTFFNYFQSKEDAVVGADPTRPERLRAALLERPAGEDILTALQSVLEADTCDRIVDPDVARRRWRLIHGEPTLRGALAADFEEVERALVDAVARRTGRDPDRDVYPRLVVSAACGACKVAVNRWMDGNGRAGLHRYLVQAFDLLAAGLGGRP